LLHFFLFYFQILKLLLNLFELLCQLFVVCLTAFQVKLLLLGLFSFFNFLWLRWCLKLWLIKLSSFKFTLTHETFSFDPFCVVIRTFSGILEIHQSFKRYKPGPFLIAVSCTEVKHVLESSYLKTCWNHIFFFSEIAFVSLDLSEINKLC